MDFRKDGYEKVSERLWQGLDDLWKVLIALGS